MCQACIPLLFVVHAVQELSLDQSSVVMFGAKCFMVNCFPLDFFSQIQVEEWDVGALRAARDHDFVSGKVLVKQEFFGGEHDVEVVLGAWPLFV